MRARRRSTWRRRLPLRDAERENWDFFLGLPEVDRSKLSHTQVKDLQLLRPLFEFSGACAGCGETAYIKLLTQLFGDRLYIANATGCSSIYGGNLPTTPYSEQCSRGAGRRGPTRLFEDNAEFGFGMRVALDQQKTFAETLVTRLVPQRSALSWLPDIARCFAEDGSGDRASSASA
jgi:pyruvate-ferredoxin/flavodoxin oxidoreductase